MKFFPTIAEDGVYPALQNYSSSVTSRDCVHEKSRNSKREVAGSRTL